jgi:hypothetical protein
MVGEQIQKEQGIARESQVGVRSNCRVRQIALSFIHKHLWLNDLKGRPSYVSIPVCIHLAGKVSHFFFRAFRPSSRTMRRLVGLAARAVFELGGQEWIGARLPRGMKKVRGFLRRTERRPSQQNPLFHGMAGREGKVLPTAIEAIVVRGLMRRANRSLPSSN